MGEDLWGDPTNTYINKIITGHGARHGRMAVIMII
jgi:hypothetical protein